MSTPASLGSAGGGSGTPTYVIIVPPTVTPQVGQKQTAGTAAQLTATSYVLQNGAIITALSGNNGAGIALKNSNTVNNTKDGTGNGMVIYPGGSVSIGAGDNLSNYYFIGANLDGVSFLGS